MKRNIEPLVELDNEAWHRISMQVAWHFRTGIHPMPAIVAAALAGVEIDKEEWVRLRTAINVRRKRDRAQASRYLKARKREERRAYMRKYMRKWREAHKEA